MSRRANALPKLLIALLAAFAAALATAPAGQATPWGELAHFGDKAGELTGAYNAFGVDPADGTAWAIDTVTVGAEGEEAFRIQQFEQVGGTWKVVASRTFGSTETEIKGEPVFREAEGIAFDPLKKRAYVLVDEQNPKKENEKVAAELWAFSTERNGTAIEPATGTTQGVLVPRTETVLTGTPIGKTQFAPQDDEKKMALVAPGGIAVNPSNHEILLTGWVESGVPTMWAISEAGKIESAFEEAKFGGGESKCGCMNSPVVTAGKILALGETGEEIFELPAALKTGESSKRAFWLPASRFDCERRIEHKEEPCPFVEKLTSLDPGGQLGGEMTVGSEGDVYVHIKVPDIAHEGALFGGVMVLTPTLEEIGWIGGGSSATETQACAVNETGVGGGGAALIAARESKLFMFEPGQVKTEGAQKILELGEGGSTSGCPIASATAPKATVNGSPGTSFPLSATVVFSSILTQGNALSTEWEFEPGIKETVSKRQQETTMVEHKFATEGKHVIKETIHTDDLAKPLIETSIEITITGGPKVEHEKATNEGANVGLSGEVNPNGQRTTCEFQYALVVEPFTGAKVTKVACPESPIEGKEPVKESIKVAGLEAGKEYHFRIVATAGGTKVEPEGTKFVFTGGGGAKPTAETSPASAITQTTATLKGNVNPNGETTTCQFEYGTTISYGTVKPCPTPPGEGTSNVEESLPITGLTPSTKYHFRLVAKNGHGTAETADRELTTLAPPPPTAETGAASGISGTGATLNGKVNPEGSATTCKFLYGTTVAYGKEAPCATSPGAGSEPVSVSAAISSLSSSTVYHYKLVAESSGGTAEGTDAELKTAEAGAAPSVETVAASAVGQEAATLKGSVNPHGEATTCQFEYGTSAAYGTVVPCTTEPGAGRASVEESVTITAPPLLPGTTYHFRLTAKNPLGEAAAGDREFTTLAKAAPTAETGAVTGVSQSGATLTGKVDPEGAATNCKFLYGPTTAYGKEAKCSSAPGSGTAVVGVSAGLGGLGASTVYHYKLIAESPAGKAEGSDAEFKTAEAPQPPSETGNNQNNGNNGPGNTNPGGGTLPFTEASPNVGVLASAASVASTGGFSVKLSCPKGAAQCAGTVTLKTLTAVAAGGGARAAKVKKAILTLATASFTVAGGNVKVVSLHLTAKAKKLLAKVHTLRARVTIVAHNAHGVSRTTSAVITLKVAKKHH